MVEAYVMGNLTDAEVAAFDEHLLVCGDCRAAVIEADEYVRAMREAAKQLRNH